MCDSSAERAAMSLHVQRVDCKFACDRISHEFVVSPHSARRTLRSRAAQRLGRLICVFALEGTLEVLCPSSCGDEVIFAYICYFRSELDNGVLRTGRSHDL